MHFPLENTYLDDLNARWLVTRAQTTIRYVIVAFSGYVRKAASSRCRATRRNATRRRGFPEDDGGRGFIRGIISCLVGFVGGKQSAQGCCRQTYYRRISYIHTFARCASKLLSLPHGTRAGIVSCFSFLMLHR